jgi:peptidyl-prolyl cis-trans isomerase SurA
MRKLVVLLGALVLIAPGVGAQGSAATQKQGSSATPPPPAQGAQTGKSTEAPALPAVSTAAPVASEHGRIIQRVIVKVNGDIFTQTDLEGEQINALRDKNRNVAKPEDLQNDATLKTALLDLTPDILVDVIDEMLLTDHGREQGYKLTDAQYQDVLNGLKKSNNVDDAGLKAAMAQEGLTIESYRKVVEKQWIRKEIMQREIMQKASLTEEESHQYYDAHHDEFMTPATVTLREILIAIPTVASPAGGQPSFNAAAADDAKTKADAARDRVVKGEEFAKVAADVSDSPSKTAGGLIGPVQLDDMAPALKDAINKLQKGGVTDPMRVPRGYQIFYVESRADQSLQPFEKVRDEIAQKVYSSRMDVEMDKFLQKLRTQAIIEWHDDGLKAMYEKRLAERDATANGK